MARTIAISLMIASGCLLSGCMTSGGTAHSTNAPGAEAGRPSVGPQMHMISGTIGYRQRIALLPGSVATITLEDISRADTLATVVAQKQINLDGKQVPISFNLSLPAAELLPRHAYSLRAIITGPDGRKIWTSDSAHIIDNDLLEQDIGLIDLRQVSASASSNLLQTGKTWLVEDIDRKGIIDSSRASLRFGADGSISGRASCNDYHGSYRLDGEKLVITSALALTRKLCAPALMMQEARFINSLTHVQTVSASDDGALQLTSENGGSILAR